MGGNSNKPEPPVRWNPEDGREPDRGDEPPQRRGPSTATAAIGKRAFQLKGQELQVFQSARRYITASQVIAVISLFFGGVLLSAVAVGCALAAYGKLNQIAAAREDDPDLQHAIRRSGAIVIAVAVSALALNAVALVFLYPMVMDALQSGGLDPLAGPVPSTGLAGSSTWG